VQRRVRYTLLECLVQAGMGCSFLGWQVQFDVLPVCIWCSAPHKDGRGSVMCGVPILYGR
jgi:hypothetical protein